MPTRDALGNLATRFVAQALENAGGEVQVADVVAEVGLRHSRLLSNAIILTYIGRLRRVISPPPAPWAAGVRREHVCAPALEVTMHPSPDNSFPTLGLKPRQANTASPAAAELRNLQLNVKVC